MDLSGDGQGRMMSQLPQEDSAQRAVQVQIVVDVRKGHL